jgi:hypothetical protein
MRGKGKAAATVAVAVLLTGCGGLSVPEIGEVWDGSDGTRQVEFEIKKQIYCDLKAAAIQAEGLQLSGKPALPQDWGVQISLLLQVDESTALNPGVTFTDPMANAIVKFASGNVTAAQSFSLAVGGTLSSTATRIDKFNSFYPVGFLQIPETKKGICEPQNDPFVKRGIVPARSSPFLQSELGLTPWLQDALYTDRLLTSVNPGAAQTPPDIISLEIKFVIISSGNLTPTWKLVRFTGNNASPSLFATGRTRTHDLIITIGPSKDTRTESTFLANQIGQAVNSGNRSLIPPQ